MTLSYDIVPGDRVGPFQLGDTLWHILELLRTQQITYPKVEVSWDGSQPHISPVVTHLPNVTLYFPPSPTQSLSQITILNLATPTLTLKYDTHVLCSPSTSTASAQALLTRGLVGRALGPTYDSKGSAGQLIYPGVTFHVSGKRGTSGGRDEVMDQLVIGAKDGSVIVEVLEGALKSCKLIPGKGVELSFGSQPPIEVTLGQTTSQDLLLDLGPPLRKYWKEDERLEKMWGGRNGSKDREAEVGECFFNYFQYGLDLLISSSGTVKKVIAHSNIPGSPLFQRYAKCPWTISHSSSMLDSQSSTSTFHAAFSSPPSSVPTIITPNPTSEHLSIPATASSSGKKKKRSPSANSDRSSTSDVSASEAVGDGDKGEVQGMTLDRIGEGGLEGINGEMRSRLVGFEGLVVEEDLASGGIASVLIYRAGPG